MAKISSTVLRPTEADRPQWPERFARHYRSLGHWRDEVLGELPREGATRHPAAVALVDGDRRWTYRELESEVDILARSLSRLGLRQGDRVVLQLPNIAEFVLGWFALQRLGAVPVHAMPGHRRHEISHLIRLTEAVAYVIPARHARFDHRELAAEMKAEHPSLGQVIVVGDVGARPDFVPFDALHDDTAPAIAELARPAPEDLALLLLSGGTTGTPKLIPRTHQDYAYNARAAANISELTSDSVYLAVLPIAFNFTMSCPGILGTLQAGGTVVLAPNPSPDTVFTLIERERVTITAVTPPLVPYWLKEYTESTPDLSSLRVLQVGAARLPDDIARGIGPTLGCRLQQVFGMAEGLLNLTALDDPEDIVCSTQGRPISPEDEVLVVDDQGNPLPDGETGELLTRGPYTLRGYYRSPEHAVTHFTENGFYRTGDLVKRLPSGHLTVVGRVKDQINRGGEKIDATEVEECLLGYPGIVSAAVVAEDDDELGERSVAFVVCARDAPTARELAAFLRQHGLAAYKAPDRVVAIEQLPLTPLGKVDKRALRSRG
ncbi:(2,3-dihydroxybenzoyl)adenylate synthase [Actinoalloteichus hymeniacidonis]|uniref:Peptide arylation enzyme n=1 Tax=Actinoalloteichus hymeniacidonis TaxID=340345 RepID=A0AAC9HQE6_9PSEU|nr:(2,3-dihydroxybenzoyl)adenylate synthase [Actinoalloteichus hymeniacidonis]AOS63702.1 peptide arylation enzyme [Actinoalloteichus hymeniacidonis]MBB5908245.1 2,3-dihydroxybenzoate-AMP ligase [Actinoalloteichus hymeniacidonis]